LQKSKERIKQLYVNGYINPMKGKKRLDLAQRNKQMKGKKYEDLYGIEKAKQIKDKISKNGDHNKGKHIWETHEHPKGMKDKQHGIEARKKISNATTMEKNPAWDNGKSFEKYPKEFHLKKPFILKRDGNCCILCSGGDICIHHIDGNKKNNFNDNLISVCRICHSRYAEHVKNIDIFFKNCAILNEEIYKKTEDIFRSMTQ